MNLIKTSFLSTIATVVTMATGLFINKAVAIYIGPAGLALIGQFQNFVQLLMTFARGAINVGVTKYVAEYGDGSDRIGNLLSTASKISFFCSFFVGLGTIVFSNFLSLYLLKDTRFTYIFVIFGFTIILFVFNNLFLSILNGLKEIKIFIGINIFQSLYSLVFTTFLIVFFGLDGALIAMVTNQSIVFFVVLWMLRKHPFFIWKNFISHFDNDEALKLIKYSALTILSAILYPSFFLYVRELIITKQGVDEAGMWQGVCFISAAYSGVFFRVLSIYYLPKLSETNLQQALIQELYRGLRLVIPFMLFIFMIIYFSRDYIINILFSEDFFKMRDFFIFYLVGDFFKIVAFLFTTIIVAKAKILIGIMSEVVFYFFHALSVYFFMLKFGTIGVTYAYAITYFIFLLFGIYIFKKVASENEI